MRFLLSAAILFAFLSGTQARAEENTITFSGKAHILPVDQALNALDQCSRPSPENADKAWLPSQDQIATLEKNLMTHLSVPTGAGPTMMPPSDAYSRQYSGFEKDGKRYIYGNFYPAGDDTPMDEEKEPVIVCDGGASFWGIVYDVEGASFTNLAFNGRV